MTLTFRYKKVRRPDGIEIKSPSIPISLFGSGMRYQFIALVDSGADISLIPFEVAELLELSLTGKREEAQGIGGKVVVVETRINAEVGKTHETYSFSIPVKVVLSPVNDEQELPILLGRSGFFDQFVITFNQKEEKILLKKII